MVAFVVVVRATNAQVDFLASRFSMQYPSNLLLPSCSGGFHVSLQESLVISDICNGPSGADGTPGKFS